MLTEGTGLFVLALPNGQFTLAYYAGTVDLSSGIPVPISGTTPLNRCTALAP
jgi:hypothetical protein